jgi:superfamily II DNA or RNA helicase
VDFWKQGAQGSVLVSTTIIETRLDIANANALIITGPGRQIRTQPAAPVCGRVGQA